MWIPSVDLQECPANPCAHRCLPRRLWRCLCRRRRRRRHMLPSLMELNAAAGPHPDLERMGFVNHQRFQGKINQASVDCPQTRLHPANISSHLHRTEPTRRDMLEETGLPAGSNQGPCWSPPSHRGGTAATIVSNHERQNRIGKLDKLQRSFNPSNEGAKRKQEFQNQPGLSES